MFNSDSTNIDSEQAHFMCLHEASGYFHIGNNFGHYRGKKEKVRVSDGKLSSGFAFWGIGESLQ